MHLRNRKLALPLLLLFLIASAFQSQAQLSPPGIANGAKASGCIAAGLSQKYAGRLTTMFYIGNSWQSDPDNFNPIKKHGIFVVNQETNYNLNKHWSISIGASYRVQSEFKNVEPYQADNPDARHELRYCVRFFYKDSVGRGLFKHSFRPEYRTFLYAGMACMGNTTAAPLSA